MERALFLMLLLFGCVELRAQESRGPAGEQFRARVVAGKLSDPWEIACGPDGYLWVTESKGYRVNRIDPQTGNRTVLLDLNSERRFPRYDRMQQANGGKPWPQGGLMGMALHPQLLAGKPFVYLMYVYAYEGANKAGSGCADKFGGCRFRGRLVRYEYDRAGQRLGKPIVLCDSIPQSNDHNGGRLTLAPFGGKLFLFYSTGDMGAGQFGNAGQPNKAQQKDAYEGKILRFNTEPDQDINRFDRWIPNDNPFNTAKQSAVWTVGHRNPQGLAHARINGQDILYQSEHGPFSDDEVNIIEKGKNYGHPLIIGFADGNYDGLAAGVSAKKELPGRWHTTYPEISSEQQAARQLGSSYQDPIASFYPTANPFLARLFQDRLAGREDQTWPSEAPSSLAVYTSGAIPGWRNSLLMPTLKGNKLIRLKLSADGREITGDTLAYFPNKVRYRDVALSADGKKIYLAIDSGATSSNPARENPDQNYHPGSIMEFEYLGTAKPDGGRAPGTIIPAGEKTVPRKNE